MQIPWGPKQQLMRSYEYVNPHVRWTSSLGSVTAGSRYPVAKRRNLVSRRLRSAGMLPSELTRFSWAPRTTISSASRRDSGVSTCVAIAGLQFLCRSADA